MSHQFARADKLIMKLAPCPDGDNRRAVIAYLIERDLCPADWAALPVRLASESRPPTMWHDPVECLVLNAAGPGDARLKWVRHWRHPGRGRVGSGQSAWEMVECVEIPRWDTKGWDGRRYV